jgi:glutamine synthetase
MADAKSVIKLAKEEGAVFADIKFIDLPGIWQHFTIPVENLDEDMFEDGWPSMVPAFAAFRPLT